jgi:hypothetical protein
VGQLEVSPDSLRAVYIRRIANIRGALLGVPIDGSRAPVELSPPMLRGRGVTDFEITADAARVFYRSPNATAVRDDFMELLAVPIDGSTPPRRVHSSEARVDAYLLSADGRRLVYNARLSQQASDVYAVPADGSAPPRMLNPPAPHPANLLPLALTPSADRVLYQGWPETQFVTELSASPSTAASFR